MGVGDVVVEGGLEAVDAKTSRVLGEDDAALTGDDDGGVSSRPRREMWR
jgi:hypothetical protein